ncbi:hypothetical protein CPC08DRAFT_709890 [Agrocybe pediades]|nr:hypothetical protein CPC08DRAFT_709890 [Agrocybe pediades]
MCPMLNTFKDHFHGMSMYNIMGVSALYIMAYATRADTAPHPLNGALYLTLSNQRKESW